MLTKRQEKNIVRNNGETKTLKKMGKERQKKLKQKIWGETAGKMATSAENQESKKSRNHEKKCGKVEQIQASNHKKLGESEENNQAKN